MENNFNKSHQNSIKKVSADGNVYCLFIKRNNIGPLEIIGVATTKPKAKNMVRTIYDMYLKTIEKLEIKDSAQEPYKPENWQDHPKEKRFSFYPLNANATAYFEIIELPLNEMAVSFRAPNKETMERYFEKKEQTSQVHVQGQKEHDQVDNENVDVDSKENNETVAEEDNYNSSAVEA